MSIEEEGMLWIAVFDVARGIEVLVRSG